MLRIRATVHRALIVKRRGDDSPAGPELQLLDRTYERRGFSPPDRLGECDPAVAAIDDDEDVSRGQPGNRSEPIVELQPGGFTAVARGIDREHIADLHLRMAELAGHRVAVPGEEQHKAIVGGELREIVDDEAAHRVAGRVVIEQRPGDLDEAELLKHAGHAGGVADGVAQPGPFGIAIDSDHGDHRAASAQAAPGGLAARFDIAVHSCRMYRRPSPACPDTIWRRRAGYEMARRLRRRIPRRASRVDLEAFDVRFQVSY